MDLALYGTTTAVAVIAMAVSPSKKQVDTETRIEPLSQSTQGLLVRNTLRMTGRVSLRGPAVGQADALLPSKKLAQALLNHLLTHLTTLHATFAWYDDVDDAVRLSFESSLSSPPRLHPP